MSTDPGHGSADHQHATRSPVGPDAGADEWDARYREADRIWTDHVNPALIAEATGLVPGTALEVGAGEGADARWLAEAGWQVRAVDISQVALDRAAAIGAHPAITWVRADLAVDDVPGGAFDLVTAHYFPIAAAQTALAHKLIDAVGPGGHLLVVAHAVDGMVAHGFDPADYLLPGDIAALLGDGWTILTDETRPRGRPAGGGHHVEDTVLHARRT
ncbi:MAG: class I SAM-dependent methyltransferase [Gordonia sp. (in: high G+C Gram-positive bacteria)]